jgi:hypothetical protein
MTDRETAISVGNLKKACRSKSSPPVTAPGGTGLGRPSPASPKSGSAPVLGCDVLKDSLRYGAASGRFFYEFLTYAMTRTESLVGEILFNCLSLVVQAFISVALGTALLAIPLRSRYSILVLAGIVLGTAVWFFSSSFAFRIRWNDVFNTFFNVSCFALMFIRSLFYHVDTIPS